jgi:arylsulfatase A-like enzyme
VILLLFDEWSYPRSVGPDGEISPALPNLRRLAGGAFAFRNARSESLVTSTSVPHLLFQTRRRLSLVYGRFVFAGGREEPVTAETPSLFKSARRNGYSTAVAGWHIPYGRLFAGQLDSCHTAHDWPGLPGLPGAMARALLGNLRYSFNPVVRVARRFAHLREFAWKNDDVAAEAERLLSDGPPNTFAYIHFPTPHYPLIFRPDGSHDPAVIGHGARAYLDQLGYADAVLGRFLDRLRARGLFDDALIVFTSDHGWRDEPDPAFYTRPGQAYRVPLVVKWPGQSRPRVIDKAVSTTGVGRLIELAFRGGREDEAERLIEEMEP